MALVRILEVSYVDVKYISLLPILIPPTVVRILIDLSGANSAGVECHDWQGTLSNGWLSRSH
jgi:hypothetical protein